MRTLPLGTVSHGTLVPEDVLDAIESALSDITLSRHDRRAVNRIVTHDRNPEGLDELFDIAQQYVPPYCYFGALEGDASDFGCWVDWDSFDAGRQDGDLPNVEDVPTGYSGLAVEVNDHGNVTLYAYSRGRRREVWSCV